MDVGGWLRGLGLGQYEEQFRDNKIDADLLPRLTVDDLKDIGVSVVGDRRRLLDAIAVIAGAGPASPTKSAPKGLQVSAERRPITVMFCDLVGSTSLAAKLDAEDWRNLVNAYLDEASAAVTGLGGHVLKKLGDGLMALFGYPQAQENDAERAVRAALAIHRALADLNARNARSDAPELSARIGIECGSVVVDAVGEVFGEAPNVAARVQGAAEPGTVLVTASVQRQTAGLFVVEDKGAHDLKGVAAPVALYRVVRASGGGRRGGARALTPLVGREDELALLTRRWSRALEGEGQFVQIVGEPGIGKSRLIEEFRVKLVETPHTWVEWAASQLLQNTPLHPLAEWGRLRFGGADATDEGRLADLENTLRLVGLDPDEYAPLIAPLVDIPLPEGRSAKFAPEELRRRQLAAVTAWYFAGARSQPAVVVFEDLHWADPTSLDLLRSLVERGAQAPLLIVATTRPEFRPPWAMRSHHGVVSLAPLDRAQVRRMVGEIASRHALSDEMIDGVGERTGGVPLFVEEVTRLLLERDVQGGAQAIPPTLQQSLAARLDRLGEAREVAQIGAVLGRDFSYRLLSDVSSTTAGFDELRLQAALDRLMEADLLFVDGAPPTAAYRFKHALIQNAAYDSLLKSRRQALHHRAAEALREANAEPEAIAHHFTEAGLDDLAIEWWGKAGDQALRRSAFQEAIAHLGKAIAMADRAGAPVRRAATGLAAPHQGMTQLRVAYGNALLQARGYSAPETREAFARARESASGDKDATERLAADYGVWGGSYVRGDLPSMREHAAAFLRDVEARPDSPEASVAQRAAGNTCWFAGEYREARDHFERALVLFEPGRDDDLAFRFGWDPGVAAMANLATALWALGEVDRATSLIDRMQTRIATLTHVGTLAPGRMHGAMFALMRRDYARAAQNAVELARFVREHDLPMFRAFAVFLEGLATAASGEIGRGLSDMRRGVELLRAQNVLWFVGLLKIVLAGAEAQAGDPARAVATLDEELAMCDRTGYRAFEAELHRARGEMLLKREPGNPTPAAEAFLTAIAVAKQQGTRSFELRAALSLAKLYHSNGRAVDAHSVLATALEGFSPTPEFPEIAEAQALFEALATTEAVGADKASPGRRLQLQLSYAKALIYGHGYAAPATVAAFERARQLATDAGDDAERFSIAYGQWTASVVRADLDQARDLAQAMLRDNRGRPNSWEASTAHRLAGATSWFAGEFVEALEDLEQALKALDPTRDRELLYRLELDIGVSALAYGALVLWPLGSVDRARQFARDMMARAESLNHVASSVFANLYGAVFEMIRGDRTGGSVHASAGARIARDHDMAMYRNLCWALGGGGTGVDKLRAGIEGLRGQNTALFDPIIKETLARAEADEGDMHAAFVTIQDVIATSERTGQRWYDAELHRTRGEILLRQNPADPAPAEEAFLTAIAIAQHQKARSFELRAALALAKLYQSTGRPAEAHAVLGPALEGFSPTPEMREIAEGQALFQALAETDDVKAATKTRHNRVDLQLALGNALIAARGYGAAETQASFERARALTFGTGQEPERFSIAYGLYGVAYHRGDVSRMREHASAFLSGVSGQPDSPIAGVAHRISGIYSWYVGDLIDARTHLEKALAISDPERDRDLAFRFGHDPRISASVQLGIVLWLLGEVVRAAELFQDVGASIPHVSHLGTTAQGNLHAAMFEVMRGNHVRAAEVILALASVAYEHDLALWKTLAFFLEGWSTWRAGDRNAGLVQMRAGVAQLAEREISLFGGLIRAELAQAEAESGEVDASLITLENALEYCERIGQRWFDAEIHRVRGEILLKKHADGPAPAEDAYLAAIAIAQRQKARSFELRAALSLAKLYQSTNRPTDAHSVLAPALEGFAPTPEMPEIAEAQALLVAIEAGAHARPE